MATPRIGKRPIREVTPPELLATLRKIEGKGFHETDPSSSIMFRCRRGHYRCQKMAMMEKFHFRRALDPEGPDVCVECSWID